ncbi:DUF4350 domain-containing protein [Sphingobacterium sp. SYP-B4668]|uniref:DUF4350 domain-containing protein n=1 Tax=Sphingobacterium sp. SYP-B4668 TaxID=2996035 RepID=UPI0022DD72A2|nr:DUF4350 domain-containing protein [Sphingobacterium sp. SYP-B4668]
MTNNSKFGIWIVLLVLLTIGIIDAISKKPIDWAKTYNQRDKIPYGLYVAREELAHILGNKVSITDTKKSIYELLEEDTLVNDQTAFIYIDDYFHVGATAAKKLLEFAASGGEVFISSKDFDAELLDTLKLSATNLDAFKISSNLLFEDVSFSLGYKGKRLRYDKIEYTNIFDLIDSTNISIVGTASVQQHAMPNFVQISWGKGKVYLHLEPEVFTNYYMLKRNNYEYASAALKTLTAKDIIWYDSHYQEGQADTPLRMILSHQGLREAWYLLLFGLLLFLVFKSKREQQAVEIVEPEPNLSKEFAKTIATLYYENGEPGNMVDKKIDYFLFDVRRSFHLDTMDMEDEKFVRSLALKSGVPLEDTQELMALISSYRTRRGLTLDDLKTLHYKIEEFKTKSNMI